MHLLSLEKEIKSSTLCVVFFLYRQIYSTSCLRHAIPSLLLQKVALSFQCLRPQKKPARRHSVTYSCTNNYKLLTVIYFLTRTLLRKWEGYHLYSYLALFTLLNSIFQINTYLCYFILKQRSPHLSLHLLSNIPLLPGYSLLLGPLSVRAGISN